MESELITVITICRNCVGEIEETIRSVINQDYPDVEYIIVDGASTDGTLDVINAYRDNVDVIVSEKDSGVYNAMNKGVGLAKGKWCIFMNGGDMFASTNAISQMFLLRSPRPSTKVYYGDTWIRANNGTASLTQALPVWPTIKRCQPYIHQSAFFYIPECNEPFFDEKYRIVSDYNTSLQYYLKYGKDAFEHVNIAVSAYKNYDGLSSLDANRRKKDLELLKVWIHYPICWIRFIREVIKYFIIYIQPIDWLRNIVIGYSRRMVTIDTERRTSQSR